MDDENTRPRKGYGVRSPYSQCPIQILLHDSRGIISSGTAFLYSFSGKSFIITNWHNVSGKHFLTKEPLSSHRRIPEFMTLKISKYINTKEGADRLFGLFSHRINIYESTEKQPLWYEHPTFGSECDVVAIPFERPQDTPSFMHNYANKVSESKIPVVPGVLVFIVGFPVSISVGFGLPIWKSGFIASEPHYNIYIGGKLGKLFEVGRDPESIEIPAFFIDSLTREGMSGSPVFAVSSGIYDANDPYRSLANMSEKEFWNSNSIVFSGINKEFVGIYGGRSLSDKENGAALGICWKEEAIREICSESTRGKHPHFL
jgi:hypothetical protein